MIDSSPHLRTSLEELSCVSSTAGWRSVRVRALGRLMGYSSAADSAYLASLGELGGPHCVPVDLRLLDVPPASCSQVEVFGEVHVDEGRPYILAKFFSEVGGLDVALYHRATGLLDGRYPLLRG